MIMYHGNAQLVILLYDVFVALLGHAGCRHRVRYCYYGIVGCINVLIDILANKSIL